MPEWLSNLTTPWDLKTTAIVSAVVIALAALRSCANSLEAIREMMAIEEGERWRKRNAWRRDVHVPPDEAPRE